MHLTGDHVEAPASGGTPGVDLRLAATAAMGAILVGLGLARFAFAPLQPALVVDGWFNGSDASLLASANLAGYLIGALFADVLARRMAPVTVLRIAVLAIGLSFVACADPSLPYPWFFVWRIVSGIGGGVIMVVSGPTLLAHVPQARRPFYSQLTLYGIGIGIVLAGVVTPSLMAIGLTQTWIALGVISIAVAVLTWRMWPAPLPQVPRPADERPSARLFILQYGLIAIAIVPHMVYLADYVARDLGRGVTSASHFYVIYGLGALIGPLLYAAASSRIGLRTTLRIAFVVQLIAVLLLLAGGDDVTLVLSSFLAGLGMPGLVALFLGRSQQIADGDPLRHRALWGLVIVSFSVAQTITAFVVSYLLRVYGEPGPGYPILFVAAALAVVVTFVVDLRIRR